MPPLAVLIQQKGHKRIIKYNPPIIARIALIRATRITERPQTTGDKINVAGLKGETHLEYVYKE